MNENPESDRHAPPSMEPKAPAAPRGGRAAAFWGFVGGCFVAFVAMAFGLALLGLALDRDSGEPWFATNAVAVVEVKGEIIESRDIVEELRRYASDSGVRAIVIRIDSPGGGIVPSQEIYREILRAREEYGKPVVASLGDVAASGGYYVASACEEIITNPGTVTGSIGVIAQWMNIGGLLEWAHLEPETITSGEMKDAGSPYRAMTQEERSYYETLLGQFHRQFVLAVAEARTGRITQTEVLALADGRVFSGQEAVTLKLADRIGTFYDAVDRAADLAGMKGTPQLIYPRADKPGVLDILMSARSAMGTARELVTARRARPFLYQWN